MYLIKTPAVLRWFYPHLVWHKNRASKIIYLTFDDGPIPIVTDFVLNTLKKFNVKATFFCIGDNVRKHPDIFQSIRDEGHQTGNHTFNHLRGWDTDDATYFENVRQCAGLVQSNLFRPPYGRIKKSQISDLKSQYTIIMWDVLSGDFDAGLKPEKCLDHVIRNTGNGSIVVFHDSLKAFSKLEYVLPRALEYWSDKGFKFGLL